MVATRVKKEVIFPHSGLSPTRGTSPWKRTKFLTVRLNWKKVTTVAREKGKRERGVAGKVIVFGILKRQGKVYSLVVENVQTETLLPMIKKTIRPDSVVFTDCLSSFALCPVHHHLHLDRAALCQKVRHCRE